MKRKTLTHQFVEFIPDKLQEGVLYVSIQYATAAHACCCGCGKEVVTPFSPTDWELSFDGETVSLDPSIGNWSFHCQSHYWIKRNKVSWAAEMSQQMIEAGRACDRIAKARQFGSKVGAEKATPESHVPPSAPRGQQPTLFTRILEKLSTWKL